MTWPSVKQYADRGLHRLGDTWFQINNPATDGAHRQAMSYGFAAGHLFDRDLQGIDPGLDVPG
jgi:hypothetical protein